MAQTQPCHEPQTVTTDGMEDLFQGGTVLEPDRNHGGRSPEPGLTLKEAVEFYKISEKSIRIKIGQGKIPAVKVPGNNGPEWRIYPSGLPTQEPERNQPGSTAEPAWKVETATVEPDWNHRDMEETVEVTESASTKVSELESLLAVIREQASKLEAANFRIGYLQSQVETQQDQIKLLTDSQHKHSGWWQRFGNWFFGKTT